MEGTSTSEWTESKRAAAEKLVKLETGTSNNGGGRVELGAKMAEAFELGGNSSREVSDEQIYRDPAPLKWRIFEAVAKTNGQRAFGIYWSALRDFMHGWLPRGELDEALNSSLGAANVHLHNELILCLLNNARCRYLPAELVSQVPASSRGKVVHAAVKPPPLAPPALSSGSRAVLPPSSPPPASSRVPMPPSGRGGKPALSGTNAVSSSPFQGKRTEGLLSNGDEYSAAATANGGGRFVLAEEDAKEKISPKTSPPLPAPLKIEVGDDGGHKEPGRAAAAAAAVKPEAKEAAGGVTMAPAPPPAGGQDAAPFSPGGKRRRDDDRIPLATGTATPTAAATATPTRDHKRGRASALEEEARLLEEEILCRFGPGADLWRPWSRPGWGGVAATGSGRVGGGQQQQRPLQSAINGSGAGGSRKRSASSDKSPGLSGHGDQQREAERRAKALKSEPGAAAGGPVANGGSGGGLGLVTGEAAAGQQGIVSERAAGRAAAERFPPSHRSQRVPGARTLGPFLQALTASQQMKVSHEVCRVMTASVKEYLRRVLEACLISARAGDTGGARQPGGRAAEGGLIPGAPCAKGMASAGTASSASNGTAAAAASAAAAVPAPVVKKQPVAATASPSLSGAVASANGGGTGARALQAPAATPGRPRDGILTPGHLQTALETTPRLVGPPSSARAQWRRVATYAGDHDPAGRGFARFGPAL